MNDASLIATWQIVVLILALVVVIAAGLLIGIWLSARRILRLAVQALGEVKQIRSNTQQIWALKTTNEVAGQILEVATEIESQGGQIAHTLHGEDDRSSVA